MLASIGTPIIRAIAGFEYPVTKVDDRARALADRPQDTHWIRNEVEPLPERARAVAE